MPAVAHSRTSDPNKRRSNHFPRTTFMTPSARHPMVSIIVPVRNASGSMQSCVDQLNGQDYPRDRIEVIVADGSSTDDTVEVVNRIGERDPRVRVLALNSGGRAFGLNAAVRAAKGEVICRIDVRTRIAPDYIRKCVETLQATGAQNVGGLQVPFGNNTIQDAIGWAMAHVFGAGNAQFRVAKQSAFVDSVYLGCFPRSVFEQVGYFDESGLMVSEDSDLNQRIRQAGGKVYLNTDIIVGYEPRSSLTEQWKLYWRYGLARAGFCRKHGRVSSWRQMVAPAFVAALPLLAIGAIASRIAGLGLLLLVAVYVAADFIVSTSIALRRRRLKAWPTLMAVFPIMHVAWGSAFWRGLLMKQQKDVDVVA